MDNKDSSLDRSYILIAGAKDSYKIDQYPEDPITSSVLSLYPKLLHFFFHGNEPIDFRYKWIDKVQLVISIVRYNSRVLGPGCKTRAPSEKKPIVVWFVNYGDPKIDDFPYQERFISQGYEVISFKKFLGLGCRLRCVLGLARFLSSYRSMLEQVLVQEIPKTFGYYDSAVFNTLLGIGLERRNVLKAWRAWCIRNRLMAPSSPLVQYLLVSRSGGEVTFSSLYGTFKSSMKRNIRFLSIGHAVLRNNSKPLLPEAYAADSMWALSRRKVVSLKEEFARNGGTPDIAFVPRARSLALAGVPKCEGCIGVSLTEDEIPTDFLPYILQLVWFLSERFNRKIVIRPRGKDCRVKNAILNTKLGSQMKDKLVLETSDNLFKHLKVVNVALVVVCPTSKRVSNILFDYLESNVAAAVVGPVENCPNGIQKFGLVDYDAIETFINDVSSGYENRSNGEDPKIATFKKTVDNLIKIEMSRFAQSASE